MSIKSVSLRLYGLPLPPTPAEAALHGSARYWSNIQCSKCNTSEPIRYVEGDTCFGCAMREFKEGLFHAINDPTRVDPLPVSPAQARDVGLDYYFTGSACKGGEHPEKKSVLSNRCLSCQSESPRKLAIEKGEKWYIPEKACSKCGEKALKRVDNGTCKGCKPKAESPSVVFMRECPDIVLTKGDAKALGFKVYRTGLPCNHGHKGFRYISTGGCLDCKEG